MDTREALRIKEIIRGNLDQARQALDSAVFNADFLASMDMFDYVRVDAMVEAREKVLECLHTLRDRSEKWYAINL